jgi:hypothetical protein
LLNLSPVQAIFKYYNVLGKLAKLATSSMKTAKSNFSSKQHGLDINAFLCRKPAEKTDDFAIIPVYCGFGPFV